MKVLWNKIQSCKMSNRAKRRWFLFLNSIIFGLIGFAMWLVIRMFALSTIDWALCFTGYLAIFVGYIGGYIFLYRES